MQHNESLQRMLKICIVVFLCSEMQSGFSHESARSGGYINAFNGYQATSDGAKHHASIRLRALDVNFGEGHLCSGAVVAPSVVLTAAHCLYNYERKAQHHPAELKVAMGSLNRYERGPDTLVYGVTHVHWPATFEPESRRDNIGILLLERDIPETHPAVQPIAIWPSHLAQLYNINLQPDARFEVTRWGANQCGVPIKQLMALNATKVSGDLCLKEFGAHYAGTLCIDMHEAEDAQDAGEAGATAGSGGGHACRGDAGAPLLYNNRLWGISSYGSDDTCARLSATKESPIVYTDVAYHSKWILDTAGTGHHQNSAVWGTSALLLFTLFVFFQTTFLKA